MTRYRLAAAVAALAIAAFGCTDTQAAPDTEPTQQEPTPDDRAEPEPEPEPTTPAPEPAADEWTKERCDSEEGLNLSQADWIDNCEQFAEDVPEDVPGLGDTFTIGSFEVTVDEVELGVEEIRPYDWETFEEEYGTSWEDLAEYPENGQFVLAHVTVTNVGSSPTAFSTTDSSLFDVEGNEYFAFSSSNQEHLDENQQPGTTRTGFIAFDVPETVAELSGIAVIGDVWEDEIGAWVELEY